MPSSVHGQTAPAGRHVRRAHWTARRRVPGRIRRQRVVSVCGPSYTADLLNGVPSIVIGIFCVCHGGVAGAPFLDDGRRLRLGRDDDTDRAPQHRGVSAQRPPGDARGRHGLGRQQMEDRRDGGSAGGLPRHSDRDSLLWLLARVAAGDETAPLLFTAFGNRFWSPGWSQPIASLPVMIYTYAVGPYDDWHRQAWAAGLVLLGLVLVTNIIVVRGRIVAWNLRYRGPRWPCTQL